jgi:hypothetical protein
MSGVTGENNDNPDPIEPGYPVNFPNPLVNPFGSIQRAPGSNFAFVLPADSVFEITFNVCVQNTGELVVVLNGSELGYTVVGKSGNGFIVGMCLIKTPNGNTSLLSINNPSTAVSGGLKIDQSTGALTQPMTCHLIIKQIL